MTDDERRRRDRRVLAGLLVLALLVALRVLAPWERRFEVPPPPSFEVAERARVPTPAAPPRAPPGEPAAAPLPFRGWPATLSNGLRVIVVEDDSAPTIAAHVGVGVGAAHDPPEHPGTAHLLEHMMFKGTSRMATFDWAAEARWLDEEAALFEALAFETDDDARRELVDELRAVHALADDPALPNELARALAELGAAGVNAFTGPELTEYQALLPANELEPWAHAVADQLADPVWRGFGNERRVVQEEVRIRSEHLTFGAAQEVRSTLFEGHPYGNPIGGDVADLAASSPSVLEAFWEAHYVPSNMVVVLVGALETAEALEVLEATFGRIPRDDRRPLDLGPIEPWRGIARVPNGSESTVELAWTATDLEEGDLEALQVVAAALASEADIGRGGRIGMAKAGVTRLRDAVIVHLRGFCFRGDPLGCERSAAKALADIRDGGVTRGRIEAALRGELVSRLQDLESHTAQAHAIVEAWVRGESLEDLRASLRRLEALEPDDVAEVARRHLYPHHYVAAVPAPRRTVSRGALSERIGSDLTDPRTSPFYERIVTWPVRPLPPSWVEPGRDWVAGSGLVWVPNRRNPLFQATLVFPVGWRRDPLVCGALHELEREGAKGWIADLKRRGVRVSSRCAPDEVRVTLQGLGSQAEHALAAVAPAMRATRIRGDHRAERAWDPMMRDAAVGWALHGDASPWLAPGLARTRLTRASAAELERSLTQLAMVPPALVYTGPHGPSQVQSMLPLASIAPPSRPPVAPVARTTSLVWRSQPGGRRVRVIRVGEPYDPAREGEYALLEAWLSGSSGVVYEAVREAAGASYVAMAEVARGEPVITTATVSLSRSGDAVAAAELLHAALTRTQVSDADWERVRATALARSEHEHIPFRALGERVRAWLSLGLEGADPRELAAAQLLELDREAFEALLAAEAARPLVIELPRPSSNGRMERLRALGDVLEGEQVALPR